MSETLNNVWKQRDAWAQASRVAKSRQDMARLAAFLLALAGGALGTVVGIGWFGSSANDGAPAPTGITLVMVLGAGSAVFTALGTYFAKELLSVDRETAWARARVLAEALKRECWRYVMHVPPYDGDVAAAASALGTKATALIKELGQPKPADFKLPEKAEKVPAPNGVDGYVNERALEQATWYEKRSSEHAAQERKFRRLALVLGGVGVVLSVLGTAVNPLLPLVPVVTTAGGAVIAWIQANRFGANVSLYGETAAQLRLVAAMWFDGAAARASLSPAELKQAEADLVERCEQVMAEENGSWRAQWVNEQNAEGAAQAIERVKNRAR